MADTLRDIGAQMANVMFNLSQRPGDALTGDHVATMDSLRKQWDAAVRAAPPSPSTAPTKCTCPSGLGSLAWPCPEHPPSTAPDDLLDMLGRVHPYAMPMEDFERAEQRLQRAVDLQQPLPVPDQAAIVWRGDLMRLIGELQHKRSVFEDWKKMRAALGSRPAEVDDEGLPPLPEPKYCADDLTDIFTAEQYRQGQRDAVAADRARRGASGK